VTQTDRREPPGRCSGCWPHDDEVAGGAVAISFSRIVVRGFRFGATMELERSSAASYGVIDNRSEILQH